MPTTGDRGRILVHASRRRNADVLVEALRPARLRCVTSHEVGEFREYLGAHGHELGAVVVTERALAESARGAIHAFQDGERVWSELPVILLSPHRRGPERRRPLRNVILLHQPTAPRVFRSVVRLALETRGHQFEVQDLLLQLEEQRDWLEQALLRQQQDGAAVTADELRDRPLATTRRRLLQRREEDRLFLARELHDTVVQRLLYVAMRLSPAVEMARKAGHRDVAERVEEARDGAKDAVKDLRRLIRELRPAGLEMGFEGALEPTLARLRPSLDVRVDAAAAREIPDDVALCLFRVAQEALRNIERHAGAEVVRLRIRLRGGVAVLLLCDDGKGFDVPARLERLVEHDHFGLIGMEEFVASMGGDLRIRSSPGAGTSVRARVPVGKMTPRRG